MHIFFILINSWPLFSVCIQSKTCLAIIILNFSKGHIIDLAFKITFYSYHIGVYANEFQMSFNLGFGFV